MRKTILVLEDDLASMRLVKEILERNDYQVIEATDGLTALELAKAKKPNLAIIDIMLPNINGYQVCEQLRKMQETKRMPIIVLTALSGTTHRIRAIDSGATDFLVKPFTRVHLLTKVKALLSIEDEYLHFERFDVVFTAFLTALKQRNSLLVDNAQQVAFLAEQVAIRTFIDINEVDEMKKGIVLQDVGQLVSPEDIDCTVQMDNNKHAEQGYKIFENFHFPIIKNIIRYHNVTLNSTDYPSHLPCNIQKIINIVALCNRVIQIRQAGIDEGGTPNTLTLIQQEVNNGLWDEDVFAELQKIMIHMSKEQF